MELVYFMLTGGYQGLWGMSFGQRVSDCCKKFLSMDNLTWLCWERTEHDFCVDYYFYCVKSFPISADESITKPGIILHFDG